MDAHSFSVFIARPKTQAAIGSHHFPATHNQCKLVFLAHLGKVPARNSPHGHLTFAESRTVQPDDPPTRHATVTTGDQDKSSLLIPTSILFRHALPQSWRFQARTTARATKTGRLGNAGNARTVNSQFDSNDTNIRRGHYHDVSATRSRTAFKSRGRPCGIRH